MVISNVCNDTRNIVSRFWSNDTSVSRCLNIFINSPSNRQLTDTKSSQHTESEDKKTKNGEWIWNRNGFDYGDCGRCDNIVVRSANDGTSGSTISSTYLGVSSCLALCVSLSPFYVQVRISFWWLPYVTCNVVCIYQININICFCLYIYKRNIFFDLQFVNIQFSVYSFLFYSFLLLSFPILLFDTSKRLVLLRPNLKYSWILCIINFLYHIWVYVY